MIEIGPNLANLMGGALIAVVALYITYRVTRK